MTGHTESIRKQKMWTHCSPKGLTGVHSVFYPRQQNTWCFQVDRLFSRTDVGSATKQILTMPEDWSYSMSFLTKVLTMKLAISNRTVEKSQRYRKKVTPCWNQCTRKKIEKKLKIHGKQWIKNISYQQSRAGTRGLLEAERGKSMALNG